MNIRMAGIDYSLAGIDIREKFSLTKARRGQVYEYLKQFHEIRGAVIITTCNRTEIYLSGEASYHGNPFELLCGALDIPFEDFSQLHRTREGRDAFRHLCRLGCGAKSQIWGEDQIITQVKESLLAAREAGATDSYLEVLFRTAVTAAKKIKTDVHFSRLDNSVATKVVALLAHQEQPVKKVLVIGNGEVGRLVAQTLSHHPYEVWMTLRQYKHSAVEVVPGVQTMDYAQRYERMHEFDAVVSATLSPHYTVEEALFSHLTPYPRLLIDLAVPRDIEPSAAFLPGVRLYDVDTLAGDAVREDHAKLLREIDAIIDKYEADFEKWLSYKEAVTV